MSLYDQKVRTYKLLNDKEYQEVVDNESYLGYEVVSTTRQKDKIIVAYKRSKELKYYNRLVDLEKKINEVEELQKNTLKELNETLNRVENSLKRQLTVNIFLTILLIVYDLYVLLAIINGNSKLLDIIIAIALIIISHALLYLWLRKIKKDKNTDEFSKASEEIKEQLKKLRQTSKNIMKKERGQL